MCYIYAMHEILLFHEILLIILLQENIQIAGKSKTKQKEKHKYKNKNKTANKKKKMLLIFASCELLINSMTLYP